MSIRSYPSFGLFHTTAYVIEPTGEEAAGRWIRYRLPQNTIDMCCAREQSTVIASSAAVETAAAVAAVKTWEVDVRLDDRPTSLTEMIGCDLLMFPEYSDIFQDRFP